ncbi:MAG: hypothetical protein EPO32_05890 [Anaerolineae bacterium]|nr:MAG: hypothetical protein EPO32_05890 [Anaerolineae bacterium]
MQQAIIIQVDAEDFELWHKTHSSYEEARKEYGITEGPFFRSPEHPNRAQVHLDVAELDRAMQWFQSDAFKAGVKEAGNVRRDIWIANKKG